MVFWKRKKKEKESERDRPLLSGRIKVGEREWEAHEEKRGGKQPQIFILTDGESEMHVRPLPDVPVNSLEELRLHAADPAYRYFPGPDGRRWEARIVVRIEPEAPLERFVKFIAERDVYEIPYPLQEDLGLISDDTLRDLLKQGMESS